MKTSCPPKTKPIKLEDLWRALIEAVSEYNENNQSADELRPGNAECLRFDARSHLSVAHDIYFDYKLATETSHQFDPTAALINDLGLNPHDLLCITYQTCHKLHVDLECQTLILDLANYILNQHFLLRSDSEFPDQPTPLRELEAVAADHEVMSTLSQLSTLGLYELLREALKIEII